MEIAGEIKLVVYYINYFVQLSLAQAIFAFDNTIGLIFGIGSNPLLTLLMSL